MYLRGDAFTREQKLRNFGYYEPLTVRTRRKIVVAIEGDTATYRLLVGEPLELAHHVHSFLLGQHRPITLEIPKIENRTPIRSA